MKKTKFRKFATLKKSKARNFRKFQWKFSKVLVSKLTTSSILIPLVKILDPGTTHFPERVPMFWLTAPMSPMLPMFGCSDVTDVADVTDVSDVTDVFLKNKKPPMFGFGASDVQIRCFSESESSTFREEIRCFLEGESSWFFRKSDVC